ncbi:hypothetical protein BZG36_00403 [Bifiguratus adelaidae]|uniref:Lysophospholipase n=1 Tax=Bifiguratus adelaidae TaxID=1938954 RepID=A0A261Y844_9FUNG|nr:hypothetical protein BZG36_00403 [Bifiguratus adelaidae]
MVNAGLTIRPDAIPQEEVIKIMRLAFDQGAAFFDGGEFNDIPPNGTGNLVLTDELFQTYRGTRGTRFSFRSKRLATFEGLRKEAGFIPVRKSRPHLPIEDAIGGLAKCMQEGLFDHIGLSEISASSIRGAHAVHPIAAVEVECSVATFCLTASTILVATDAHAEGDLRPHYDRFQEEYLRHNLQLVQKLEPMAYAHEFFPPVNNASVSITWSDIATYDWFANGSWPMPILLIAEVLPNDTEYQNTGVRIPGPNNPLVEYNPFEWGTWSGDMAYFMQRFDNATFAMGTSLQASSFWYLQNMTMGQFPPFAKRSLLSGNWKRSLRKRADVFPAQELDSLLQPFPEYFNISIPQAVTAPYPNPFLGLNNSKQTTLQMIDGSLTGQTIPFWGLLWSQRKVDLIIAFDASGETNNSWQNGTNMINTAKAAKAAGVPFPDIPSANTILSRRYNEIPTFFGRNATSDAPIILYVSNAPWTTYSNISFASSGSIPYSEFQGLLNNSLCSK